MNGRDDWIHPEVPDYALDASCPLLSHVARHTGPWEVRPHAHAALELGVMLQGEQEQRFGGFATVLRPGDVWLCAPWEPHGCYYRGPYSEAPVVIFQPEALAEVLGSSTPWLQMFAVPPEQRPQASSPEDREGIITVGRLLAREIEEERAAHLTAICLHMASLLVLLARHWAPLPTRGLGTVPGRNPLARILPAVALATADPGRRISPAEAAVACSLSVSRFHVIFREAMGRPFKEFCREGRLRFASHLLLTTPLPISDVAERAGFTDASHMHHVFLRQHGCTPTEYRAGTMAAGGTGRQH